MFGGWPWSKHTPAFRPQSGCGARGVEDRSAAAWRGCLGEGARPPPRVRGLPLPSRPPGASTERLAALQPAPSPRGSGLRACGAQPRPRPGQRCVSQPPSPSRCQARFCFLEALKGTFAPFILFSSRRPDSLRGSPERPFGLTPRTAPVPRAATPAPQVKRSESLPVRAWSAVGSSQLLAPPCAVALEAGGGGEWVLVAAPWSRRAQPPSS